MWATPDGKAFATIGVRDHVEHHPIRSTALRRYLSSTYYRTCKTTPNAEAIASALGVLEGRALYEGQVFPTGTRVARDADGMFVYLDLGDSDWKTVEIDSTGWRLVASIDCPIRFRRSGAMRPLPLPERGGSLSGLRDLVNVGSDDDFRLVVGWLVGALRPTGPYPLLALHGEQGSAKTSTARMLRALVDPNASPVRAEPRDARDLMIAARHSWVIALDNLSQVQPWLSDALCRLATGGGFSTRELYSDDSEMIFESMRPVILTGISELATRGDLLDRCIVTTLPRIWETARKTEAEIDASFEAARPKLLGATLDAISTAMLRERDVRLDRLPRMADFAIWVSAAEPALGWSAGSFVGAYSANRLSANETALEASRVAAEMIRLAARAPWQGTAAELLGTLEKAIPAPDLDRLRKIKGAWPGNARALAGHVRRIAPNLRAAGIAVELSPTAGSGSRKLIYLSRETSGSCDASVVCDASRAGGTPDGSGSRQNDSGALQCAPQHALGLTREADCVANDPCVANSPLFSDDDPSEPAEGILEW
jgi:hypothetical protein